MKKLILFSLLVVSISISANAQEAKNEAKVNLLGLIIGLPDISYERLLNDKMGIGLTLGMGLKNGKQYQDDYRYVVLPYYRYYLGNKYASGFFLEAHASVISAKKYLKEELKDQEKFESYYGLGAAIGVKLFNKEGFLAESYAGLGHQLNVDNEDMHHKSHQLYPRIGVSLGKRF